MKAPLYTEVAVVQFKGKSIKALVPADRWSEARLSLVKVGKFIMTKVHSARNGKQHRLLWAVLTLIADNSDRFSNEEHVLREIKLNTGHVLREYINIEGVGQVVREYPDSICYESMPQSEFDPWFEKAVNYIRNEIWHGITLDEIKTEIAEMLGFQDETWRLSA